VPVLLLVVPSAALAASTGIVQAVEECRLEPGVAAPPGSKWLSRINRDHRRCWFLSSRGGHRPEPSRSASVRNHRVAGDMDAGQKGQERNSDLQIGSAPTRKADDAMTAEPRPAPQIATPSVERLSENLNPRSVPTIAYRVRLPSTSTSLGPTDGTVRTVLPTRGSISKSNLILLAGATAALFFAGVIRHIARRGLLRPRRRSVADRHGVRERVVGRSSVAVSPPPVTTDRAEDLRRKMAELKRERPDAPDAGGLPHHIKGTPSRFRSINSAKVA
jgi:hypothetical protein